jgi:transcriptional regulator with XRE-family HTH domain
MAKHEAQGRRLRMAIERSGLERADIATRCGISVSYIARMVAGDRSGADHLPQMATVLHVEERWLRFGDDDARPPWAMQADALASLNKLSENVQTYKAEKRRDLPSILEELLSEQKQIRILLESTLKELRTAQHRSEVKP